MPLTVDAEVVSDGEIIQINFFMVIGTAKLYFGRTEVLQVLREIQGDTVSIEGNGFWFRVHAFKKESQWWNQLPDSLNGGFSVL